MIKKTQTFFQTTENEDFSVSQLLVQFLPTFRKHWARFYVSAPFRFLKVLGLPITPTSCGDGGHRALK